MSILSYFIRTYQKINIQIIEENYSINMYYVNECIMKKMKFLHKIAQNK
jgi:hypothetical protein